MARSALLNGRPRLTIEALLLMSAIRAKLVLRPQPKLWHRRRAGGAVASATSRDRKEAVVLRPSSWPPTRALAGLALLCATLGACDEKPELPPQKPDQQAAPFTVDPHCTMTFRADHVITLGQLVLVLQRDPLDSNSLGFSLMTLRPGLDGSRMIFGTFVRTESVVGLTKSQIRLTSGSFLNPSGNGIFTSTASYQPKLATLHITSVNEKEVQGSFSGDFYHFVTTRPGARPEVIQAGGTFTAALMVR